MIEREQIEKLAATYMVQPDAEALTKDLMALIAEHDEQYRELVEAVLQQYEREGSTPFNKRVMDAFKPFLPRKPSLSEKLSKLALAGIPEASYIWRGKVAELAEEARQLEAALEDKA